MIEIRRGSILPSCRRREEKHWRDPLQELMNAPTVSLFARYLLHPPAKTTGPPQEGFPPLRLHFLLPLICSVFSACLRSVTMDGRNGNLFVGCYYLASLITDSVILYQLSLGHLIYAFTYAEDRKQQTPSLL